MPLSTGTRLGPYEIVSRLGAGGMGEVWKARDTRLDRSVAVKILPAKFASDSSLKLRFEREARTISQLSHPHICTLFDVGENYMVMELIDGETLAARLTMGPLPLSDVLRYGAQVADALDFAHRAAIVHRDLKPGNIMLTLNGAKLLDFGLAKAFSLGAAAAAPSVNADDPTPVAPLTRQGMIVGTFHYMAPEQIAGDEAGARTDIFAFGAVLYEMLTGKRAFDGSSRTSLIAAILTGEPPPVRSLQPVTPPELERLITKCLAKSPDDRWQSAREVAEALQRIGEAASQPAIEPSSRAVTTPPAAPLSIAVLPFANLSGDPENEYFSDGMTIDIIAQLALFDGLAVISRSSVISYKNTTKGPRAIAEELGVTHVLEGSVRRAGPRVRIVPQLVDAATGRQLWTKTFDRQIEDIFELQAEVAREIGRSLRVTLSQHVQARLERRPTDSMEAYDLFLRARALDGTVRQAYDAKVALFERAIAIDENFALAHAWLAVAYATDGSWAHGLGERVVGEAIRCAERAIAIDPDLAIPYYALAGARFDQGRLREARAAARRAVELDPNLCEAMIAHVWVDWGLGNYDEMIPWCERAMKLDPKNPYAPNDLALAFCYMLDTGTAERWSHAALEIQPDFIWGYVNLVQPALAGDRYAEALRRSEMLLQKHPDHPLALVFAGEAALYAQEWTDARRFLERLNEVAPAWALTHHLPGRVLLCLARLRSGDSAEKAAVKPLLDEAIETARRDVERGDEYPSRRIELAAIYAMRGETAEALHWLERAYETGWRTPYHVRNAPWFQSLEREERFRAVVRRMEADAAAMRRRVSGEQTTSGEQQTDRSLA